MNVEKSCLDCKFAKWRDDGLSSGYCWWEEKEPLPACLTRKAEMVISRTCLHVNCPAWEPESKEG